MSQEKYKFYLKKFTKYYTKNLLLGGNGEDDGFVSNRREDDRIYVFTKYIYDTSDDPDSTKIEEIINNIETDQDFYDLRDNVLVHLDKLCDKSKIQKMITSQTNEDKNIKTDCEKFSLIVKGNLSTNLSKKKSNNKKLNMHEEEMNQKFENFLNLNNDIITKNIKDVLGDNTQTKAIMKDMKDTVAKVCGESDISKNITLENINAIKNDNQLINNILNTIKENTLYNYYAYFVLLLINKKNNINNIRIKHILSLLMNKIANIMIGTQAGGSKFGAKDVLSTVGVVIGFAIAFAPAIVFGIIYCIYKAIDSIGTKKK